MNYWGELEQEPYDSEEFVERLAWRCSTTSSSGSSGAGGGSSSEFDPEALNRSFMKAIRDLSYMAEKQRKKVEALEGETRKQELIHRQYLITDLMERNKKSAQIYRSLDEKINSVATKVVHLGDQLESVNIPRSRDVEALKLMKYLDQFLDNSETSLSPIFTDKSRLHEAADVIQKLQLIAQDLPPSKFDSATKRIDAKYSEIERSLIEEFVKSHRSNDNQRMKDLALILSHFKGYNQCVDAFIEQIQLQKFRGSDIFKDIVPLCESSWNLIRQVFPNPQQVMGKFVLNVYHSKVKDHVSNKLMDKNKSEVYLDNLFNLYSNTTKLTTELAHYNLGTTSASISSSGGSGGDLFLTNLTKTIFRQYLESYINIESRFLNERAALILNRYYDSKGHVKKSNVGSNNLALQDLKRDIHGFIASKANINVETISYGGETFLSEEVAINILQLTKTAFRRCQVLSTNPANDAMEIFNILVSYLVHGHIDYALEIGLQGIPLPECKTIPELYFFDVIGQTNAIIHLLEKQFSDSLVPLVASTPRHADCLQTKKNELEKLEHKLDAGLDRTLNAIVGWVKTILTTEQKKSDFNSEDITMNSSAACGRTVRFINYQVEKIKDTLDGKNIEFVLLELGIRFHRILYDHLQTFTYSSTGVMSLICDVNEYRKCIAEFKVPKVIALFDTLHAMCNLLILPKENLRSAMQGDMLASLDRAILDNWVQLRVDYRAEKLGNYII